MAIQVIARRGMMDEIKSVARNIKEQDARLHRLCFSALYHYKECGDTQYMTAVALATAIYKGGGKWDGRSVFGAGIRKWFEDLGGVRWSAAANKGEGGYRASKSPRAVKREEIDMEYAEKTPFYVYARQEARGPKEWDGGIRDMVRLRDKALKLLEEGATKAYVLPENAQEQRAIASAMVNSINEFLSKFGDHAAPEVKEESLSTPLEEEIKVA